MKLNTFDIWTFCSNKTRRHIQLSEAVTGMKIIITNFYSTTLENIFEEHVLSDFQC